MFIIKLKTITIYIQNQINIFIIKKNKTYGLGNPYELYKLVNPYN